MKLAARDRYLSQDKFDLIPDLVIGKQEYCDSTSSHNGIAPFVKTLTIIMDTSVDLDGHASGMTIEVEDKSIDDLLTPKL